MKPEFYVIRLGRSPNPNKAGIPFPDAVQRAPAPLRQARGVAERFRLDDIEDPPIRAIEQIMGREISRNELRDPVIVFDTEEAAEQYANEQAAKIPKTLFAVMGVLKVFETTQPTVIEKRFNDKGELILVDNGGEQ